jgi:hypothetical protein
MKMSKRKKRQMNVMYVMFGCTPGFAWEKLGICLLVGVRGLTLISFLRVQKNPLFVSPS